MSESELEWLAKSEAGGRWGFSLNGLNSAGQSVLTVDLPGWMARTWTLNLLSMRYTSGVLVPPHPPDTQVQGNDAFARLDYGVSGAMEVVRFDYPKRGMTMQFHAATFRLYIDLQQAGFAGGQPVAFPPLVGGFVSPTTRGNSMGDNYNTVTLTENEVVAIAPAGSTTFFTVPARARAYRIVPRRAVGTALYRAFQNSNAQGALVQISTDYASNDVAGVGEPLVLTDVGTGHLYPYRSAFVPLLRMADVLAVVCIPPGATPTDDGAYRVQWLLDVG
jgi:hypothetical protein